MKILFFPFPLFVNITIYIVSSILSTFLFFLHLLFVQYVFCGIFALSLQKYRY